MRRLVIAAFIVATVSATAEALTIKDIIELSKAGLGDEVLLALIEVDRGVYAIDTATLKQLKTAGISERVIVAMVRSGREVPVETAAPPVEATAAAAPAPQVVVVDHHDHAPEHVREVAVPVPFAVPVYVPVVRSRHHQGHLVPNVTDTSSFVPFQSGPLFVPFQSGPATARPIAPKTEPVYWGWNGKRRPDAWKPAPDEEVKRRDLRK